MVPYCHDECQRGLAERVELMKNGFRNYNGRYPRNIPALTITRSAMEKALVLSGGILRLLKAVISRLETGGER